MSGVAYLWKEGLVSQIGWWKDAKEWMQRQTVGRWRGWIQGARQQGVLVNRG